jgi:hypothetical protein
MTFTFWADTWSLAGLRPFPNLGLTILLHKSCDYAVLASGIMRPEDTMSGGDTCQG